MSRFDFLQGRAHAALTITDTFARTETLGDVPSVTHVLDTLERSLPRFPKDYAAGMQSVITKVKEALAVKT